MDLAVQAGGPVGLLPLSQGPGSALLLLASLSRFYAASSDFEEQCQKLSWALHVLWTSMKFTISLIVINQIRKLKKTLFRLPNSSGKSCSYDGEGLMYLSYSSMQM